MSCFEPSGFTWDDIDGFCPECGEPTCNSEAYECCAYSPVICSVCGNAPCDDSC